METERKFYISELRKRKGLTQDDMAKMLEISRTTYNFWERNFKKLPVSKANYIVKFLSDGELTLDNIIL